MRVFLYMYIYIRVTHLRLKVLRPVAGIQNWAALLMRYLQEKLLRIRIYGNVRS